LGGCGFQAVGLPTDGAIGPATDAAGVDLSAGGDDLALADGAGADLGTADLAAPDGAGADLKNVDLSDVDLGPAPCPRPQLLVALEDLRASNAHGRVLRQTLLNGTPASCPALTGGGLLSPQPFSVAAVDGRSLIAVLTTDALHVVDSDTDTIRWEYLNSSSSYFPVDVFPLRDTGAGSWWPPPGTSAWARRRSPSASSRPGTPPTAWTG
jgi:hypothetical protein